jgi:hypothetical protein
MWGYSGGALASEWAAELQANYAPEIPFVGMAIGGVTPNVENVFNTINKGPFAGLSAAGFLGLGNAYPEFGAFVQQSLVPATADKFNQAGNQCFYADVVGYAGQDIFPYFKQGQAIFKGKYLNAEFKWKTNTNFRILKTLSPRRLSERVQPWVPTVPHPCPSSCTSPSMMRSHPSPIPTNLCSNSATPEPPSPTSATPSASISLRLRPAPVMSSTTSRTDSTVSPSRDALLAMLSMTR